MIGGRKKSKKTVSENLNTSTSLMPLVYQKITLKITPQRTTKPVSCPHRGLNFSIIPAPKKKISIRNNIVRMKDASILSCSYRGSGAGSSPSVVLALYGMPAKVALTASVAFIMSSVSTIIYIFIY
jgi:hypothetical protein